MNFSSLSRRQDANQRERGCRLVKRSNKVCLPGLTLLLVGRDLFAGPTAAAVAGTPHHASNPRRVPSRRQLTLWRLINSYRTSGGAAAAAVS